MNQIIDFFKKLLDSSDWPPRWHCGKWTEFHGWLYIMSDLLIWSAYFTIPIVIIRYISRKKNIQFTKLYFLFAAFILACGATHFLDAVAFWIPVYRLSALVRFITGVISWVTVFYLVKYLPVIFSLRSQSALQAEIDERKKTELELKKSRKDYELLIGGVKEYAIFLLDTEGRVASWNSGAANIKGYEADEIMGKSIDIFYTGEEIEQGEPSRNLQMALQHGRYETTGWRVRKDKSIFWADIVFSALYDEDNQFYGYAKVTRDITEKRKAEERIAFLATIASNIQDPVIATDNNGTITRWNHAAELLLGWKAEEVVGKADTEILKIDYLQTSRDLVVESFKEKKYWQGEVIYHSKTGGPVNVLVTVSQLLNADGHTTGNLALVRDISDRKKAEDKLKEFEYFFNNSNDLSGIANAEGYFEILNPSFNSILGYTNDELTTRQFIDFVHPDDVAVTLKAYNRLKAGASVTHFINRYLTKNGDYLLFDWNATPNVVTGKLYCIARDITARKKAEDELLKLNEELEQKVEERTKEIQRSEAQYRHIFSNNPMPMLVYDLDTFKILDANQPALQQYGYSRQEFLAMTVIDIRPDEEKDRFLKLDHNFVADRPSYNKGIWQHRKKDGNIMQVEIVAHEVLFEGIKARLVLAKDITEQKNMQDQLSENKKLLELFIKYSPVALAMLDNNMVYLAASTKMINQFALGEDDFIGKSIYTVMPDIPQRWVDIHNRSLNGAIEKNDEDLFVRQDGSRYWLRWEVHPWHKASGEIGGIIIFSEDITERKLGQVQLTASEMRFRVLLENSTDGIDMSDEFSNNIYRSPGAAKITGVLPKENQMLLTHPDDLEMIKRKQEEMIKNPGVPFPFQGRFRHALGHYIWLEGTLTNLLHVEGVHAYVTNFRDVTERKELEELLHKANTLARIGGWEVDLIKGTVFWSDITREIHETAEGYVPNLETGINFYKEGPGRDLVTKKVREAIELGTPWDLELQIITAKNNERWVRSIGETEFAGGKCIRIYGSFQDITGRKTAEIERERLNERLLLATQSAQLGLWDWDVKNNLLIWDEGMYKLYNLTENEFTTAYEGWASRVHPDDRQRADNDIQLALAGKKEYNPEFRIIWNDGSVHYVKASGLIEKDSEGNLVRMTGFNWDVTESKIAEEKIKSSEEHYRMLVEQSVDGIFLSEANGRYVEANSSGCKMLGYTREEIITMSLPDILTEAELDRLPEAIANFEGGNITYSEWVFKRKDGSTFIGEVIGRALPNGRLQGILRDITDRKTAEEKIKNINIELEEKVISRTEQLRKINEELEAFSYSISHDLRAPLRGIIGFTNILEEDYTSKLDEEAKRITGVIKNNTIKMGNLIDDLLSFSRLGRQPITKTTINMNEMVSELMLELGIKIHESKISLVIADLPAVQVDPVTIKQVWTNLISNAVKYSAKQAHPLIEIGHLTTANESIFFVKDNGVGFDSKYKEKLFKVFQRLHSAAEFEGTGVGLAIVDKIISKHGGKVWAEGTLDKGACFYFSLPNSQTIN